MECLAPDEAIPTPVNIPLLDPVPDTDTLQPNIVPPTHPFLWAWAQAWVAAVARPFANDPQGPMVTNDPQGPMVTTARSVPLLAHSLASQLWEWTRQAWQALGPADSLYAGPKPSETTCNRGPQQPKAVQSKDTRGKARRLNRRRRRRRTRANPQLETLQTTGVGGMAAVVKKIPDLGPNQSWRWGRSKGKACSGACLCLLGWCFAMLGLLVVVLMAHY